VSRKAYTGAGASLAPTQEGPVIFAGTTKGEATPLLRRGKQDAGANIIYT
jgi:hypothetical protein